jgi:hypothetical protein
LNCNHQTQLTYKQTKTPEKKEKKRKKKGPSTSATIHDDQPSPNLALFANHSPFTSIIN